MLSREKSGGKSEQRYAEWAELRRGHASAEGERYHHNFSGKPQSHDNAQINRNWLIYDIRAR